MAELALWEAAGQTADIWLRDDDACRPTAELDCLIGKLRAHEVPCLLAVVPMLAETGLEQRLRTEPLIRVAMHGVHHADHAAAGSKKAETPAERGLEAIVDSWKQARTRLVGLFGAKAGVWYVPPWNRIEPAVASKLVEIGFRAVSTFADDDLRLRPPMIQRNTHVDIIDWKGGRVGRSVAAVAEDLAAALARARVNGWHPVGILLHHLVHDELAWAAFDHLLAVISTHPTVRWRHPDELLLDWGHRDA